MLPVPWSHATASKAIAAIACEPQSGWCNSAMAIPESGNTIAGPVLEVRLLHGSAMIWAMVPIG